MTLGTQTQPHGKLLDYEQFIDHQLNRTRARIKFTDIATACLILAAGFLAVLFLEVIFDHAVGLPLLFRRIVLAGGLSTAAAFSALRIAMPLLRRVNGLYAARTIEDADPAFKNSLINYLELRRYRTQMPKAVMATLESRAVTDLTHVEVDNVVNQQRMLKAVYVIAGLLVIFSLYIMFSPKSVYDSTRRAFLADLSRPTNTQFVNIKPGNDAELSQVVAGDNVTFSVHVEGVRPPKVLLHYSVDGGKFFAVRDYVPGQMYDPWQVTLPNVQQSMDYYVTGGDAESSHYHLEVSPAPTITSITLDLDFPKYTNVPRRTGVEGGNVEAIEGTMVTVHAKTNMPATAATLDIANATAVSMDIASDDPTELSVQFKVTKTGTYKINFRTTGNQLNPNPVIYDIIAIPDRPPTGRFVQPDKPSIVVPANVAVDLVMAGTDDHGVQDATLHVTMGNDKLLSKNMLEGRPQAAEFRVSETLDPAKLRLKPGAKLNYWLTVRDNKEPSSNKFETAHQLIEITQPVSPAEKKKVEDDRIKNQEPQGDPTAATSDDAAAPDKTPPSEPGKPGDENAGAKGQADDQNPQKEKEAPGTQGTGSVDETNPNPNGGADGPNNASPQLSAEDQKIADKLKQAFNKQNPSNAGGGAKPPANSANSPPGARADGQPSQAANQSNRDPGNTSQGPRQRPAVENPSQSDPQAAPPQPRGNPNDRSQPVERGNPDGNPPAAANGDQRNGNAPKNDGVQNQANNPNSPQGNGNPSPNVNQESTSNQKGNAPDGTNKAGENKQGNDPATGKPGEGQQNEKPAGQRGNSPDGTNKSGENKQGNDPSSPKAGDAQKNDQAGRAEGNPSAGGTNKAGDNGSGQRPVLR